MYPLRPSAALFKFVKQIEKQYSTNSLKLDKVLILNKLSRLEIEEFCQPQLNSKEIEENIRNRGIDYECLVKHHEINKKFKEKVHAAFQSFGAEVRSVNRFNCTPSDIEWCDAVIPVGGDGTFLHTARYIPDRNKPVIGFNSNPSRSEGFLCLPKEYSSDVSGAIRKLQEGKFRWMFRTRVRVNFHGEYHNRIPTELHDIKALSCRMSNTIRKERSDSSSKSSFSIQKLPVLALNEVFMSEIFAAKVSYFEMRLNDSPLSVKIKSSGLCVCTGTGSTSWNLSINRLSRQDIHDILQLYVTRTKTKPNQDFEKLVTELSNSFDEKLKFEPEKRVLGYTIRDLISFGVWPSPKGVIEPRGFAETIEVKSKCLDAGIIIDGGISFPFTEGDIVFLETRPEDALKTVVLLD